MPSIARRLAVTLLVAACARGERAQDSAAADSAAPDTAVAATTLRASAIEDPPPPPIDTTGTLRLIGGDAAAPADTTVTDSVLVTFHYDSTAANGLEVTFTAAQRDSVTVSDGAYIRGGGANGATGSGTITARTPRGVIVADLSSGIRNGSALTKCSAQPNPGRGRCGVVVLEVRFTPRNGREARRNARFDLGN